MKVLIVDDQYDEKITDIAAQLKSNSIKDIEHVMYTREAFDRMLDTEYDLILLDLHVRESLGDDISPDAGAALLELIFNDSAVKRPKKIVGITSHEDAYNDNTSIFKKYGVTLHLYEGQTNFINEILPNENQQSNLNEVYDVAIITALRHIEFEALLKNGLDWEELNLDDCNKYYRTKFNDKQGVERRVIATFCPRMGMPVSSAVAMKVINKFSPQIVVMTGIAAGIEGKAELGDILAGEQVWDWGSGKLEDNNSDSYLNADPDPISMDPSLSIELKDIAQRRLYVDKIKDSWPAESPSHSLNMIVGAIASGSAVLADSKTVNIIKKQKRSVIGVEMEAFGILTAASLAGAIPPKTLILKSVCDFANPDKNDNWQRYAAYTSTHMAFELLRSHINFK
jgi:nucleoside phosphorylase